MLFNIKYTDIVTQKAIEPLFRFNAYAMPSLKSLDSVLRHREKEMLFFQSIKVCLELNENLLSTKTTKHYKKV